MSPAGLIGVMARRMKHLLGLTASRRRPRLAFPTLARCFNYPLYRRCASSPLRGMFSYPLYAKLVVARV